MQALIEELKRKIVAAVNLQEVKPEEIKEDEPLFGAGLGLDSIDALELVVMLERDYGIVIQEQTVARAAFTSVRSLASFVSEKRKK
ncbi:MAG TPA: phosphopantetheine-binding protein [Verrucomicrobiae bacterium]|nr:phosphopantetheine-binding protein [Verrucomicrobiae bacterium]